MIRNTFCILKGIGEKLEKRFWKEGILTWEAFTDSDELPGLSYEKKRLTDESLFFYMAALNNGNAEYFGRRLKHREHWRLFDYFKDYTVCMDIETNGLQPGNGGYVTAIGLYDGYDYKCLIKGKNLNAEKLNKELERYKFIVTFYGTAFDIPFLLRTFRGVRFNLPHFDLCFAARRLRLKGGLKKLEQEFGIERDESVKGFDGYEAVKLWEFAKRGSSEALDLLVKYNREDTVNLMQIATILYGRLRQLTGIEEYLSCGVA